MTGDDDNVTVRSSTLANSWELKSISTVLNTPFFSIRLGICFASMMKSLDSAKSPVFVQTY